MQNISPEHLASLLEKGPVELIDVRSPAEYREAHLAEAKNIPLDSLDTEAVLSGQNGAELYFICKGGSRGAAACKKFITAGYSNVSNVEGGISAWTAAGYPVVQGEKTMSIERQVRIVAGFLVLLGVVLGLSLHIAFLGLSAFVGAGLMFAGVTDTCGMGIFLAKMPWNK